MVGALVFHLPGGRISDDDDVWCWTVFLPAKVLLGEAWSFILVSWYEGRVRVVLPGQLICMRCKHVRAQAC